MFRHAKAIGFNYSLEIFITTFGPLILGRVKSTFFESPITHKRFIVEHSYISYGKRQKSCTLIVILVILSYLTSPIFNSSSKATGFFFANEEVAYIARISPEESFFDCKSNSNQTEYDE